MIKERHGLTYWTLDRSSDFISNNGRVFKRSQLNTEYVLPNDVEFVLQEPHERSFRGDGVEVEQGTKVIIRFESGNGYTPTSVEKIVSKRSKHMYLTPFNVRWAGTVEETYEISTDQPFTIGVNATKNVNDFIRSKTGTDAWTGYREVTLAPETTWKSDNPSVARA